MAIDMSEVRQLFFEESFENIDVMESSLLDLEVGSNDRELINTIFRAAHSIKGGASIFKFEQVIAFAHIMETLLDEMREGQHVITQELIDVLLRAGDVLRMMLTALQENAEIKTDAVITCRGQLQGLLKTSLETVPPPPREVVPPVQKEASPPPKSVPDAPVKPVLTAEEKVAGWHIVFEPSTDLFKTGNDPLNFFRELAQFGELSVKANTTQLPKFKDFKPEQCYLSWEITLQGNIPRKDITEIFEWVEEECVLHITALNSPGTGVDSPVAPPAPIVPTPEIPAVPAPQEATPPELLTPPAVVAPKISQAEQEAIPVAPHPSSKEPDPEVKIPEPIKTAIPTLPVKAKKTDIKEKDNKAPEKMNGIHPAQADGFSVRVGIDKIDALINIVGELVITQSMLDQVGTGLDTSKVPQLRDGLSQLERNTRELQEGVMRIRMLPISYSFNRFPRLVHDLSEQLGKKVELKLSGEQTELDKTVLEKMNDPLVHLVRNALDHGIELPAHRRALGKSERGLLHLHAFHQSSNIVIQISDDGAGFNFEKIRAKAVALHLITPEASPSDEQLSDFIFLPGFSTAEQVNDLSGRGVGLDVVRRNIRALAGTIEVFSKPAQGSTFSIRLPLTLAILDGQLVRVGQEIYILPLLSILESLRINPRLVNVLAGNTAEVYRLRSDFIPILRLYELFNIPPATTQLEQGLLVVVENYTQRVGLFVDELLSQQQVVIKSLESNFRPVTGISGATILGDGSVALILDIAGLIQLFYNNKKDLNFSSNMR